MDKVRALREAADAEIEKNIVGFKEELFNLRFQKKYLCELGDLCG